MKNGSYQYDVIMKVPLGKRNGALKFTVLNNTLVGLLTMFTETLPITEGHCSGDAITFSGEMKTLLSTFAYNAQGIVVKDQIELQFHTECGDYSAIGRKACVTGQENSHE